MAQFKCHYLLVNIKIYLKNDIKFSSIENKKNERVPEVKSQMISNSINNCNLLEKKTLAIFMRKNLEHYYWHAYIKIQ